MVEALRTYLDGHGNEAKFSQTDSERGCNFCWKMEENISKHRFEQLKLLKYFYFFAVSQWFNKDVSIFMSREQTPRLRKITSLLLKYDLN